jgi:iron complex transport system ATP-binding protein
MTAAIETSDLTVRVGSKALIENISLSIASGETVALVGPNGAGKSTLLRTLSGEIAPSGGTIKLKGRDPRDYTPTTLALHRAVLAQHVNVAFPFSVAEVVRMGAGQRRGLATDNMVEDALAEVDMAPMRDRIIGTLSGGEQQRVHFARVLVQLYCGEAAHGPGILLLDEPTASLDLCHQLDLLGIVRRCNARGTTIIAIMHDLNLAALFAAHVVALHQGRLAGQGAPGDIINDRMLAEVFSVTGAANRTPGDDVPFVLPHGAAKVVPQLGGNPAA